MPESPRRVRPPDIPDTIGKELGKKSWTDAFFRSQMRGAWRRIWFRWPRRNETLKAARVETPKQHKNGNVGKSVWYKCAVCGGLGKAALSPKHTKELRDAKKAKLPRPEHIPLKVAVDHKEALVPTDGSTLTWDQYLFRLFCGPENLQVLCELCHSSKSREENTKRRQSVKERKLATTPDDPGP